MAVRRQGERRGGPGVRLKSAIDFIAEYKPISYTIDGVLPSASIYGLTARRGAGKTAFMLMAALAIAAGRGQLMREQVMVYSFARIGAAIGMRVQDVYPQNRRLWLRLHEKGGKQHAMPCHHNLDAYLHEYIEGGIVGQSTTVI